MMRDPLQCTSDFLASAQLAGLVDVDLPGLTRAIREDGQAFGWPGEDGIARLMFMNYLAGMLQTALAAAPRYITCQVILADMEIYIAATRPGETTPLKVHDQIREICVQAGWEPGSMSLADFVKEKTR